MSVSVFSLYTVRKNTQNNFLTIKFHETCEDTIFNSYYTCKTMIESAFRPTHLYQYYDAHMQEFFHHNLECISYHPQQTSRIWLFQLFLLYDS